MDDDLVGRPLHHSGRTSSPTPTYGATPLHGRADERAPVPSVPTPAATPRPEQWSDPRTGMGFKRSRCPQAVRAKFLATLALSV
jgi:hypothetical protein